MTPSLAAVSVDFNPLAFDVVVFYLQQLGLMESSDCKTIHILAHSYTTHTHFISLIDMPAEPAAVAPDPAALFPPSKFPLVALSRRRAISAMNTKGLEGSWASREIVSMVLDYYLDSRLEGLNEHWENGKRYAGIFMFSSCRKGFLNQST